jgi:hypothetical protein
LVLPGSLRKERHEEDSCQSRLRPSVDMYIIIIIIMIIIMIIIIIIIMIIIVIIMII